MSDIQQRKLDHLALLQQDPQIERGDSGLADIRLLHRALPELDFDEVDTRTTFLDIEVRFPFYICLTCLSKYKISYLHDQSCIF
ncbi:MAG TPA: hypothetical protein EYP05_02990, partial [Piscirickettsiaceae bacterium]|nr:hypothetical protein [Piscirickettsiaceae bacterium]